MSRVMVWREDWLPPSETFVVNQLDHLKRWTPTPAGVRWVHPVNALTEGREIWTLDRPWDRLDRRRLYVNGRSRRLEKRLQDVDLVHAHFGPDAVTVLDSAVARGVPLVVTFHGYDAMVDAAHRQDWALTKRWHDVVAGVALFIAVSDAVSAKLIDLGVPKDKVITHHIGIPLPPDPGPREDAAGVLFVGRLVDKKGPDTLLRALALLPEALLAEPVRVIGDGPLMAALRTDAARLNVSVEFMGAQPPQAVDAEMRRARVLVAPSRTAENGDQEGLPMTLLEAGARRLPAVTGVSGGTADAVQNGVTGFVVEDSPEAFADAMTTLLTDAPLHRNFGESARRFVESNFDIVRQTAALELIYDDVLARRPRSR